MGFYSPSEKPIKAKDLSHTQAYILTAFIYFLFLYQINISVREIINTEGVFYLYSLFGPLIAFLFYGVSYKLIERSFNRRKLIQVVKIVLPILFSFVMYLTLKDSPELRGNETGVALITMTIVLLLDGAVIVAIKYFDKLIAKLKKDR